MKRLTWLLCAVAAFACGCVEAQSISIPNVTKGKYVYTIPAGFTPPLIGKSGMAKIQSAASKLHFPYYVVLVEQFDGESDEDAAALIDSIAEKWQEDPDFDSAKSSIFMLSYSPRKYRFIAGSYWESQLGFGPDAHVPFNDIFVSYVSSSRKDPQTGIIKMMQAVDHHLYVESDPKTIARRKEAERKAEIARRAAEEKAMAEEALRAARGQLGAEVGALDLLLANEPRFLPADAGKYRSALSSVDRTMRLTDPAPILSAADSLRLMNSELEQYVQAKQREARELAARQVGRAAASAAAVIVILSLLFARFRKYRRLISELDQECRQWESKILNAQPKYLSFEQERNMIIGLRDLNGKTSEVYESTTREVDDIFIAIGAMQNRIDECRATAKRASYANLRPLEKAIADIKSEFTIATNQLSGMDLFAPETRQVTLRPSEVMQQLEERFQRATQQWSHLKKAAEIRYQQAEDAFPQTKLDDMIKTADEHAIPRRWLADHPLFGDDASDTTLYSRVNDGRLNDPVTYLEKLEDLQAKEAEIADRLSRLVESLAVVQSQRIDSVPDLAMTVLQPQDDPTVTFDTARREEARFTAFLASRDDIVEMEQQAAKVHELYRKCVEQTVMAQAAISAASDDVNRTRTLLADVSALAATSEQLIKDREQIHSNMQDAVSSLNIGRRYLESGQTALESASALLIGRRHLEAQNTARQAIESLNAASREFGHVQQLCKELDRAKQCFEDRLAHLDDRRAEFESRIGRYGGSVGLLPGFQYTRSNSAVNYYALTRQLDALESSWEDEVRSARRQFEEAERRRREEEEAEERRRSSDDHFGSSSGGSFGSGSSSSSGGSWGGSSSSSSSSSSGGSW